jgi:hypothetical protein
MKTQEISVLEVKISRIISVSFGRKIRNSSFFWGERSEKWIKVIAMQHIIILPRLI